MRIKKKLAGKKIALALCAAFLAGAALGGCASTAASLDSSGGASATRSAAISAPPTSSDAESAVPGEEQGVSLPYSKEAQEKYGLPESLTLSAVPQRVVVMTLGPAELLHALGIELLAIPDTSDKESQWVQESGAQLLPLTAKTVDTEQLLTLEPDLILLSASKKEAYGTFFEEHGIPVYYTVSSSMDSGVLEEVKAQITLFGTGFGRTTERDALLEQVQALEEKITQWKAQNPGLQGQQMMILLDAPFTYTNTSTTSLGSIMASLGLENMADRIPGLESVMGTGTLQISTEVIVEQNPPLIIAQPTGAGAGVTVTSEAYQKTVEDQLAQDGTLWEAVEAVKEKCILYLGTDAYPGTSGLGIFQCYTYLMEALPALAAE